jgi:hypothetical protein
MLQARHLKPVMCNRVHKNCGTCNNVPATKDFAWDYRIGISKMNIITPVLKKDKDNDIQDDQQIIDEGCNLPVPVIISDW